MQYLGDSSTSKLKQQNRSTLSRTLSTLSQMKETLGLGQSNESKHLNRTLNSRKSYNLQLVQQRARFEQLDHTCEDSDYAKEDTQLQNNVDTKQSIAIRDFEPKVMLNPESPVLRAPVLNKNRPSLPSDERDFEDDDVNLQ